MEFADVMLIPLLWYNYIWIDNLLRELVAGDDIVGD